MPLKIFLEICLLRAAPQDLTSSRAGMIGALAAYALADIVAAYDILTLESAVSAAVVDTLLLAVATQLLLQWRRFDNRMTQTLTALAGSGALLSMLAWTGAVLMRDLLPPEWIWAAFLVWYTLVFGHILRHALSISFALGVGAGILYLILSMGVTGLFMNSVPAT